MKSKNKQILFVIPTRGGSKMLKNKNVLMINGKPMWKWTAEMVDKAAENYNDNWIILSTDIKEILDEDIGLKRPKRLCGDKSPLDDTLRWCVEWTKKWSGGNFYPDYVVMCHCNIPIRKEGEIDKLIKIALKNPEATAVCTGVEVTEPPEWMFENYDKYFRRSFPNDKYRKQDMFKRYNIDGAIQIHRVDALMKGDGTAYNYFGDKIIIVPHERKFGSEIDTQADFNYVEYLMKQNECR